MSTETYHGSCQCGAVRYTAKIDLEKPGAICNCSRCGRLGTILEFVPRTDFTLEQGEDALTEYRFNKDRIAHQFCKTCGVQSFAYGAMPDGTPMVAVNIRTLEGIDPLKVPTTFYDGAAA